MRTGGFQPFSTVSLVFFSFPRLCESFISGRGSGLRGIWEAARELCGI